MSIKKCFSILLCTVCLIACFSGCSGNQTATDVSSAEKTPEVTSEVSEAEKKPETSKETSTTKSSFTNKYGTATTVCAHPGCSNYIASSGDTNCCATHSNRCLECKKYIDEDATWCVSCLEKAAKKASSKHHCEVCGGDADYSINGITGSKEYYCATHYKEMKDLLELLK